MSNFTFTGDFTTGGGGGGATLGELKTELNQRKQTANIYLADTTGLINADPTIHEVSIAQTASDDTQYTVLSVYPVVQPPIPAQSIFALLSWTAVLNAGTGNSKWMISESLETPGSAPTAGATNITDVINATATKQEYMKSGRIPVGSLPSGNFSLVLVGKPDSPGGILTATVLNQSMIEITY